MGIGLALHTLAAVVWVGGMFFGYGCLRPAMSGIDAPIRVALWARVLSRFFTCVIVAIVILLLTGFQMMHMIRALGGPIPLYVHLMLGLGILMMLLFAHLFFAPFKRLKRAVAAGDTALAVKQIGMIRVLVGINLAIGLVVTVIGAGGPYFGHTL